MSKKNYSALVAGPIEDTIMAKYKRTAVKQDLYDKRTRPNKMLQISEAYLYLFNPHKWNRIYGEERIKDSDGNVLLSRRQRISQLEHNALNVATSLVSFAINKDEIAMFLSRSVEPQILKPHLEDNYISVIYECCTPGSFYYKPGGAVNALEFIAEWLWKCHPMDGKNLRIELNMIMYQIRAGRLILPDATEWQEEVSEMFICSATNFLQRCLEWDNLQLKKEKAYKENREEEKFPF